MLLNLQILRAFAALSVVLFHTIGTSSSYGFDTRWISYLEGWGASGVDVFFVISGFVMLYTQLLYNA
ncbi:acyltransferase family protein [bacterium]|nr:acyltransferase family protein [bacterium]